MPVDNDRELMIELYDAAVAAALPGPATARAIDGLPLSRASRIWLYAFGKAAAPMANAAAASLLRPLQIITGGVVVAPDEVPPPYPTMVSMRGDHPIPGRNSFAAAAKIGEVTMGRRGNDVAIVLISGGATAMIGAPLKGMRETDFVSLFELLLGSGLDIVSMNAIRKRFSRWGAGRLALALAPAATYCFAISDVPDDDLAVIGSGPCVPDETRAQDIQSILQRASLMGRIPQAFRDYLNSVLRGAIPETPTQMHPAFAHVTAKVIGNTKVAVNGAAQRAGEKGFTVEIAEERLSGEASRVGEAIARQLVAARAAGVEKRCFVWGGETTVTLGDTNADVSGGGRCQELALASARALHAAGDAAARISVLAAGTDGRDGATDAAGAVVDASTWDAIIATGRDPAHALAVHESHGALRAASALIGRRETGTNVNDVVIGLV